MLCDLSQQKLSVEANNIVLLTPVKQEAIHARDTKVESSELGNAMDVEWRATKYLGNKLVTEDTLPPGKEQIRVTSQWANEFVQMSGASQESSRGMAQLKDGL